MKPESSNVLIVDDDVEICQMIKAILNSKGYSSSICSNGDEVFDALAANKPDVIVMDMLLSGSDGRDICRKLKSKQETKSIPVLMMSAHPSAEITCTEAGANQFISKPFGINELLDRLELYAVH
ncbi:MAG TPA: response regulator transcription factor [Puia sp.]|jgi:DNA-binding response OmpR family regulator|nr:response regulator transcription factor [Puia sp.]